MIRMSASSVRKIKLLNKQTSCGCFSGCFLGWCAFVGPLFLVLSSNVPSLLSSSSSHCVTRMMNQIQFPSCRVIRCLDTNWKQTYSDCLRAFWGLALILVDLRPQTSKLFTLPASVASARAPRLLSVTLPNSTREFWISSSYSMYRPRFLCNQRKPWGLITGQRAHMFPQLLSINEHTDIRL